jgi:hypothetical protein
MFENRSGRNEHSLQRNFHRCFLPSFGSFGTTPPIFYIKLKTHILFFFGSPCLWQGELLPSLGVRRPLTFHILICSFGQAVSEEKILKKSANQKQELPVAAMFVNGSGQNEQIL